MKIDRVIGYPFVVLSFVAAIVVLLPLRQSVRVQAFENKHYTHEFTQYNAYSREKILAEIASRNSYILHHARNLAASDVHQNFVFVNWIRDQGPKNDLEIQYAGSQLAQLNVQTFEAQTNYRQMCFELSDMRDRDEGWLSLVHPDVAIWHWEAIRRYAALMLPYSILFALLGFAGLLRLWGFAKLVYVAGCALSFLFSVAGGAVAQTVKKAAEKKKEKTEHVLQIDARASIYTSEGPPNPGLFLRVTNETPRTLVENITVWNPRSHSWYSEFVGGIWAQGRKKTRVLAMGVVSDDSNGNLRVGAGVQVYRSGRFGVLAIPLARWERSINGPPNQSVNFDTNPNIRFGKSRWSLAPEVGIAWHQNAPWTWLVGAALRFTPKSGKLKYEQGMFTNQKGFTWMRPRAIATFPY